MLNSKRTVVFVAALLLLCFAVLPSAVCPERIVATITER